VGNRIFARLQDDLACQPADGRRTRCDQSTLQSWDRSVAGEDYNWTATYLRRLAPPHLSLAGWEPGITRRRLPRETKPGRPKRRAL
jgi:hypothetical protein